MDEKCYDACAASWENRLSHRKVFLNIKIRGSESHGMVHCAFVGHFAIADYSAQ